jgi:hypothetical protein
MLIIVAAGLLVLAWHRHLPLLKEVRQGEVPIYFHWDSQSYLFMASGKYSEVASPFSKRALYPFMAATLTQGAHVELANSFLILNVVGFALLAYCISALLEILVGLPWLALLLLLTPMPLESLELGYLPDLFHGALTALFLLLLAKNKLLWALAVLMVAFAVRESTLLLCVVGAVLGYRQRQRTLWMGSLTVLVIGTIMGGQFAKLGKPNLHHMPETIYMALKVPFNFCLNFLGVCIWTEVNHIGEPVVKWPMPALLQRIMTDREIGLSFDWRYPLKTLIIFLSLFGTGPLLLARLRKQWRSLREAPLVVRFACIYGLICFVMGPTLGNWVERLIGYGWPAFWVALPWLVLKYYPSLTRQEFALLAANFLLVAWWPSLFGWTPETNYPLCALGLLLLYLPTLAVLARLDKRQRAAAGALPQ